MKSTRVLIMSYSFPPRTDGASTLMYNLCKCLPKERFTVMTSSEDSGIYCWNNSGMYDPKYILECETIRLPVRRNNLYDYVKFILLSITMGILQDKRGRIDCLLAVYPNLSNLVAAYVLRRLINKPLILYMHDLFSEVKREAKAYKVWSFVEERIFASSSVIIVTNQRFRYHYARRGLRNVRILHSCTDLTETARAMQQQSTRRNLRIVFTGSVYTANEDAVRAFLETVERLSNVEVLFATSSRKVFLREVNVGFLPKERCLEMQRNADVLFLPLSFGYPYSEEIECAFPIKALEYLAAGKPILAVVPKGSYMECFIRTFEVGEVVTSLSIEGISEAVERLRDEKTRRTYSRNALKTALLFDNRVQARRLLALIEEILSTNAKSTVAAEQ